MIYPYLKQNYSANPEDYYTQSCILPINWKIRIAYNLNDKHPIWDEKDPISFKDIIVYDEFDRLVSPFEIEEQLVHYNEMVNRSNKTRHYRKRQRSTSHRTMSRTYATAPYKKERIMLDICKEQGVKCRTRLINDWEGMYDRKRNHNRSHIRSSGWKNRKIKHQWQVHAA